MTYLAGDTQDAAVSCRGNLVRLGIGSDAETAGRLAS